MRTLPATALLLTSMAVALNGQTTNTDAASPAQRGAPSPKLVTVVGCVSSDDTTPGQYTIMESKGGAMYRLSGADMHTYVGQQVQVTGGPRRFRITGGLLPSPNAAAQAGAVDQPPAAAATSGRGTGPTPEFRVKSVKTVASACPEK